MKKILSFIIILVSVVTLNAQTTQLSNLVIRGESKMFQKPDIMEVNIDITNKNKDYKLCQLENIQKVDSFKNMLKSSDISSLVMKDISQRLREEKKYLQGENIFVGYIANYNMKLQLSTNTKDINALMKLLRNSGFALNYNMKFKLSEKLLQECEDSLLKKAIENAHQKGKVIASSCNVKLESIQDIKYGLSASEYSPIMQYRGMKSSYAAANSAFSDPENIELTDSVIITWSIK